MNTYSKKLIIDVGMHQGQDTDYYLRNGYRVVGIDADINLIKISEEKYKKYIKDNSFVALNYAISSHENEPIVFNISQASIWSSLRPEIANRHNFLKEKILVKTKTLASIFSEYGIPLYCKIDIEGYDNICLNTLLPLKELPAFISVESECLGEGESFTDSEALQTLDTLYKLGYRKFKLIDQASLSTLHYKAKFYYDDTRFLGKIITKWQQARLKNKFIKRFGYTFPPGSSGPFGDDLEGVWMNYEHAQKTLIRHRRDYFKLPKARSYGFWCDWHATSLPT